MARCPNCESWIWFGPGLPREEVVCPDCGAILKLRGSLSGLLLGSLEVSGFAEDARSGNWYIEKHASEIKESLPPGVRKEFGDLGIRENEEVDTEWTDVSPAFHPRNRPETADAGPSFRGDKGR